MVSVLKLMTVIAITFLVLPAHSRSEDRKGKSSDSRKSHAISWEITNIKDSEDGETKLTFKRKAKGASDSFQEVKMIDDDGMLSLAAIQHSFMQSFSDQIVDANKSWFALKRHKVEGFSRFKDAVLISLEKLKKYDTQSIRDFNLELQKLSRVQRLSREEVTRIAELKRLIPILELEKQHAGYIYKFIESRDEVSAEDISRTLGKFLMTFGHEHAHRLIKENGDTELLRLFDSKSENSLSMAFSGRPLWILGDNLTLREPRTSIMFSEELIGDAPVSKVKKRNMLRTADEEEVETEEKPQRIKTGKGHQRLHPELDLSDLDE